MTARRRWFIDHMRARISTWGAVVSAVIGLGASIASLIDMMAPEPAFCAESGCATVRASAWAHPLGVPMPVIGIAFFALMLALAMPIARLDRPRVRRALAIAGAVGAIGLIAVQAFAIGAWCKLCMIADPSAIALAGFVLAGARTVRFAWWRAALAVPAVAATVVALGLIVSAASEPAPAPSGGGVPMWVARAQAPGQVTIVELVDFQCPFCRRMQARLVDAIAQAKVPVHVVRKMVPLAIHPGARPAAMAWCCAEAQGKGDAMAAALFAADEDQLTPEGCEKIAARVGCDLDRYRTSMRDPAITARIDADIADARGAGVHALPTLFVGSSRVIGASLSTAQLAALIAKR